MKTKKLVKMNEAETKKANGGAVTAAGVAAGVVLAWGCCEAGRGFINMGIGIGNKIFRNNARYL